MVQYEIGGVALHAVGGTDLDRATRQVEDRGEQQQDSVLTVLGVVAELRVRERGERATRGQGRPIQLRENSLLALARRRVDATSGGWKRSSLHLLRAR